jgi:hypothetical protein
MSIAGATMRGPWSRPAVACGAEGSLRFRTLGETSDAGQVIYCVRFASRLNQERRSCCGLDAPKARRMTREMDSWI